MKATSIVDGGMREIFYVGSVKSIGVYRREEEKAGKEYSTENNKVTDEWV